jgi:hypothetical protein
MDINNVLSVKNEIAKYLSAVHYPANKDSIVRDVTKIGAGLVVVIILHNLPHLQYHTPREVISQLEYYAQIQ